MRPMSYKRFLANARRRRETIAKLLAGGATQAQVAKKMGISRQRVAELARLTSPK